MSDVAFSTGDAFANELRTAARLVSELRRVLEAGLPAGPSHLQLLADCVDRLEAAAPELASEVSVDLAAARLWIASINAAPSSEEGRGAACRARGYLDKADGELVRLAHLGEAQRVAQAALAG